MARLERRTVNSPEFPNGSSRSGSTADLPLFIFNLYKIQHQPGTYAKPASFLDYLKAPRALVKEFRFVMITERISSSPEARGSFSYLREGYFLDVPFRNARGVTQFNITGITHWTPILVDGQLVDGDAAIQDFDSMINFYLNPDDGTFVSDWEIRFMNFTTAASSEDPFGELEWIIHPNKGGLKINQTSKRPFQKEFSFEFMGLISSASFPKSDDGFVSSSKDSKRAALYYRDTLRPGLTSYDSGLGALSQLNRGQLAGPSSRDRTRAQGVPF